jgi:hypothetical protein
MTSSSSILEAPETRAVRTVYTLEKTRQRVIKAMIDAIQACHDIGSCSTTSSHDAKLQWSSRSLPLLVVLAVDRKIPD